MQQRRARPEWSEDQNSSTERGIRLGAGANKTTALQKLCENVPPLRTFRIRGPSVAIEKVKVLANHPLDIGPVLVSVDNRFGASWRQSLWVITRHP